MGNLIAKTLAGGALAIGLAAAGSSSAAADMLLGGPAIEIDVYNSVLAATLPPSVAIDVRISGRLIHLDPYNASLAAAVAPSIRTIALDDLYASYAFAPSAAGARLWEGPVQFDK